VPLLRREPGKDVRRRASLRARTSRIVPPRGAPNVLLIITDDADFGVPGTFGGVIPTPRGARWARRTRSRSSMASISCQSTCK